MWGDMKSPWKNTISRMRKHVVKGSGTISMRVQMEKAKNYSQLLVFTHDLAL
jgi:hypothetical protein